MQDPEISALADLYREGLMKYVKKYVEFRDARNRADRLLLPSELLEADQALKDLENRAKASQSGLNEMLAANEDVKAILQRNVAALDSAIEAMELMTKTLSKRIQQKSGKSKDKKKRR